MLTADTDKIEALSPIVPRCGTRDKQFLSEWERLVTGYALVDGGDVFHSPQ